MWKDKINIFYTLKKTNLKTGRKTDSNRPTFYSKYTTLKELVIKNTLVKIKTIFVLMEGFHLPQRHRRCSERKGILSNIVKFTAKHLCQSLFFNKAVGFSLWKERLWHRRFHVNFVKFLRTHFLQNTSGRLLLSLWEDRIFHYKSTFLIELYQREEIGSYLGKRCSMVSMFSRLHFKLWKINTLQFLEKI